MGLFSKIKSPVFTKRDSEAEKHLAELKEIKKSLTGESLDKAEQEIIRLEAGIIGEKQVCFELENSHMPMFVLHDLFLEHNGLKAQIDFLVITRKNFYIIECKNLYGNIEIDSSGSFVRSYQYKGKTIKEGIYSPITQNQRHLELIKAIREDSKGNPLSKIIFNAGFSDNYHAIVVLANPKTVLNDRYAKKEVKSQVIRADQLVSYIKQKDNEKDKFPCSEKEMEELAEFFMAQNKENPVDYVQKFRDMAKEPEIRSDLHDQPSQSAVCPECGAPMVLRMAKKGPNAGKQFYGCSKYPKCKGVRNVQAEA
ncbi:MAG: NERD domain-containing protein [Lachnospiraceae bacterium]|nr:NERD domain-containing protein [Lachnospiraceae bacterium]